MSKEYIGLFEGKSTKAFDLLISNFIIWAMFIPALLILGEIGANDVPAGVVWIAVSITAVLGASAAAYVFIHRNVFWPHKQ